MKGKFITADCCSWLYWAITFLLGLLSAYELLREQLLSPRLKAITTGNGTIECLDFDCDLDRFLAGSLGGLVAWLLAFFTWLPFFTTVRSCSRCARSKLVEAGPLDCQFYCDYAIFPKPLDATLWLNVFLVLAIRERFDVVDVKGGTIGVWGFSDCGAATSISSS